MKNKSSGIDPRSPGTTKVEARAEELEVEPAVVDMEDRMEDEGQTILHEMDSVVEAEAQECRVEETHRLQIVILLEAEAEDTGEGTKVIQKRRRHQGGTMSP